MAQVKLGWPRFITSFDMVKLQDPSDPTQNFYLKGLDIQCWASGDGFTLLGLQMGALLQITSSLAVPFFAKIHETQLIDLCLHGEILATVGEEEEGGASYLKIWDMSRWEKDVPFCTLFNKVATGRKTGRNPAVAVSMTSSFNLICVGFADTTVHFYYGDLRGEKILKWKTLRDGVNALTDGALVGLVVETVANTNVVFVITENTVCYYLLEGDEVLRQVVLDVKGCDRGCWSYCRESRQLMVNRREMVYFYDVDACTLPGNETGKCYALAEGNDKLQMVRLGPYLVLLAQQPAVIKPDASSSSSDSSMMSMLTVYDMEFQWVAFSLPIKHVCQMFVVDREVFVLHGDGLLSKLLEKPLKAKLDIVLKKELFEAAISLARRSNSPDLNNIYLSYADHLYKKGDFETAVEQYIETIGYVEPSYVIKQFLDGTRVAQLSTYIEALHKRKLATGQHHLILLSSYVKTNSTDRIGAFVDNPPKHADFDVDEAVQILRTAEYSSAAAKLAQKSNKPQLYIDILVEDLREYATAITFLGKMSPEKMTELLDSYGAVLLENKPDEMKTLLAEVVKSSDGNMKGVLTFLLNRADVLDAVISTLGTTWLSNPDLRRLVLERKLQKGVDAAESKSILEIVQPEDFPEALRLAQFYRFPPLVIHVLRSQKRMDDLLRYLLREGEIREVVRLCDEVDIKEMWIDLVTHVSKHENIDGDAMNEMLEKIKNDKSAHPLVILEVLSRMSSLKVADIRDYVIRWLERENSTIVENETTIRDNEGKLRELHKEIDDLENQVQIFQATKCSACDGGLQVPAVHFLCKHSYHLHCFESYSEGSDACPACSTIASRHREVSNASGETSQPSHIQFRNELENGADVMNLITEYIGRGVFDQ